MTPIELLALTRLLVSQKNEIRDQVSPGEYNVDFNVHVRGNIKVEADVVRRATVNVPWTEAYALFRLVALQGLDELIARVDGGEVLTRKDLESIKQAGFLSEDIMVETMQEAWIMKNEPKGEGSIMDRVPEIAEATERVKELIADRLGPAPQRGRVLADLAVEEPQELQTAKQVAAEVSRSKELVCKVCGNGVGN